MPRRALDIGITGGAFPFAKIHSRGERPTRSTVCTSSPLRSLRPCLGQGASLGEKAVLADSGRAGVVAARVGRVRSLAFWNSLLGRFVTGPLSSPPGLDGSTDHNGVMSVACCVDHFTALKSCRM